MRFKAVVPCVAFLFALATAAIAVEEKKGHRNEAAKQTGLDKFKQLAGDWVGKEVEGRAEASEIHVKYKVTSAGHTVVEVIFPGTEHEMVTVIHPDGDDLLLTHYCLLGNQPQMKAPGQLDGNQVAFKFVRATNLKSDKDKYMHDVTFTFQDQDTLKANWTHYDDGKPSGAAVFELKRKK